MRFPHTGVRIAVLEPGKPARDCVHGPPGTGQVVFGAGDGPERPPL